MPGFRLLKYAEKQATGAYNGRKGLGKRSLKAILSGLLYTPTLFFAAEYKSSATVLGCAAVSYPIILLDPGFLLTL